MNDKTSRKAPLKSFEEEPVEAFENESVNDKAPLFIITKREEIGAVYPSAFPTEHDSPLHAAMSQIATYWHEGTASNDHIEFEYDGITHTIKRDGF